MKRLSFLASVITIGLGTAAVFGNHHPSPPSAIENVNQEIDGAFRDGVYLGKLAAESGTESHVAIGRWATAKDRATFASGYQRGYNESLASRVALANRGRRAE